MLVLSRRADESIVIQPADGGLIDAGLMDAGLNQAAIAWRGRSMLNTQPLPGRSLTLKVP